MYAAVNDLMSPHLVPKANLFCISAFFWDGGGGIFYDFKSQRKVYEFGCGPFKKQFYSVLDFC